MKKSQIFVYFFVGVALIFELYFWFIPLVGFIIQVILIAFALFLLVWIFKKDAHRQWKQSIIRYSLITTASIGFCLLFFLSFFQYQHLVPGKIYDVTLTHSGQEVVFLQMAHIATPSFFDIKHQKIQQYAQSGYTILMEWVRPGTPQNQAIFNQKMWFQFTPTLYTTISSFLQLESQDNQKLYLGISTGSLVSVDLSIDDMIAHMGSGALETSTGTVVTDIESQIAIMTTTLSSRESDFARWVVRWLLSWSLKNTGSIEEALSRGPQKDIFDAILRHRNQNIIKYIFEHPHQNIVIVYGALHFNGVYEWLQKIDPNWHTLKSEAFTPYQ